VVVVVVVVGAVVVVVVVVGAVVVVVVVVGAVVVVVAAGTSTSVTDREQPTATSMVRKGPTRRIVSLRMP
jgi:hypothetical protein